MKFPCKKWPLIEQNNAQSLSTTVQLLLITPRPSVQRRTCHRGWRLHFSICTRGVVIVEARYFFQRDQLISTKTNKQNLDLNPSQNPWDLAWNPSALCLWFGFLICFHKNSRVLHEKLVFVSCRLGDNYSGFLWKSGYLFCVLLLLTWRVCCRGRKFMEFHIVANLFV